MQENLNHYKEVLAIEHIEKLCLITNNCDAYEKYKDMIKVEFKDDSYINTLYEIRNKIHSGYVLLTHPMAGSLKPNQTPYKSVLLVRADKMDYQSIALIENAIESTLKFLKQRKLPNWSEKCLKDFRTLDLSFIDGAFLRQHSIIF